MKIIACMFLCSLVLAQGSGFQGVVPESSNADHLLQRARESRIELEQVLDRMAVHEGQFGDNIIRRYIQTAQAFIAAGGYAEARELLEEAIVNAYSDDLIAECQRLLNTLQ